MSVTWYSSCIQTTEEALLVNCSPRHNLPVHEGRRHSCTWIAVPYTKSQCYHTDDCKCVLIWVVNIKVRIYSQFRWPTILFQSKFVSLPMLYKIIIRELRVFTSVTISSTPFCDTTPRIVAKIYLGFGAIYCLHPQDRRVSPEKKKPARKCDCVLCLAPQCTLGLCPLKQRWLPRDSAVSCLRKWLRAVRETTGLRNK